MLKSKIGDIIKQSPYKREYIEKYLGISRNTLSNWCTGRTFPSVLQIFKLTLLLDVKFEDLYEYRGEDITEKVKELEKKPQLD